QGMDGGREPAAAGVPVPASSAAGAVLPLPVAAGLDRVLGQPLRPAQRGERLRRLQAPHAPRDAGGRPPALTLLSAGPAGPALLHEGLRALDAVLGGAEEGGQVVLDADGGGAR